MKERFSELLKKPGFWVVVGSFVMGILILAFYLMIASGFKPYAVLELSSNPKNATVFYNFKEQGAAPFILKDTKTLAGKISVTLPGYNKVELDLDKISIKPGEYKKIRVDLLMDTKLIVKSEPSGANIYIDNERWGATPFTFDGLIPVGTHEVRVELLTQCYGEVKQTVIVKQSLSNILNFKLPQLIMVTVATNPPGAKVKANGEEWGETPLVKCVAEGKYKVVLEKEGLVTEEKELDIKDSTNITVRMYQPGDYKKKDAFAIDSDQPGTAIYALGKLANHRLFGNMVNFGSTPTFLAKDDILKQIGTQDAPASYIIWAQKDGYSPGITEVFENADVYFPMSWVTDYSKALQKEMATWPTKSSYPRQVPYASKNQAYSVEASVDKTVLKDNASGATWDLFLEEEKDYYSNQYIFSEDSTKLWYFRNNKGIRELVERDIPNQSETVLDKFDPKASSWAKGYAQDTLFPCLTCLEFNPYSGKLLYFMPGSDRKLNLVTISPGGGGRRIIYSDLVPSAPDADNYKIWMESANILKISGVFPGGAVWEGLLDMKAGRPIRFKIRTDPNPNSKVGILKQLDSGMTMFPSCALVEERKGEYIIGANIYNKLAILFVWMPLRKDWEFVSIRVD